MTILEADDAAVYVEQVRRQAVSRIETELASLEARIAQHVNGPIEIPRAGSGMVDAWSRVRHELGAYAHNFTVAGERLFVKSRRAGAVGGLGMGAKAVGILVDTLDAFLDRYDPGSPNVNDALEVFCRDLRAVADLRAQRGAILRDGLDDPRTIADDPLELAALTGPADVAALEVQALEEELRAELDQASEADWQAFYAEERAAILDQALRDENVDSVGIIETVEVIEPVGIKEIGDRLGVKRRTVDQWLQRGIMPAPRWVVGGRPAWNWPDVEMWAQSRDEALGRTK